jgi:response regulator RpfG family c-di-GMP phosphodiesterase
MDGGEVLPKIQKICPKTVKIVFTGLADLLKLENSGTPHMDAFLVKPVKTETLLMILDQKIKAKEPEM